MSEQTNSLFEAIFALEELREILRQTAPSHELTVDDGKRASILMAKARKGLDMLERGLK